MKKLITLACLGVAFAVSTSAIAAPSEAQVAQRAKMGACNKEAKGIKGDERKAFMKKCLSKDYVVKGEAAAKPAAAKAAPAASGVAAAPAGKKATVTPASGVAANAANTAAASGKQQNKMKTCNEEIKAKKLKGEERRKFMATCLKG